MEEADGGRSPLAEEKSELRRRMRELRASLSEEHRGRLGGLIEDRVGALPEFGTARCVLLFYSFGSEVPTSGLIRRTAQAGKRVLLPYLEGQALEAAEVSSDEELIPTRYGPKEPGRRVSVDPEDVDLVVTPGLAFDRRGHRLGYGRGYYDGFLGRLRGDALRAGIAFGLQVVDEVPAGPGDERVHVIVTEDETIDCR